MKIGRGNSVLMLSMTQLEYDDIARNLTLQEGERVRVVMTVIDHDHVSLRFNGTDGFALYQQSTNARRWQAQADLRTSGATRLNTFGQTEVTLKNGKLPGEVIASIPAQRSVLQQRTRRPAVVVAQPKRVVHRAARTGQVKSARSVSDDQLIRLKRELNETLAQGFSIKFDDLGQIEYFERRIG